MPRSTPLAQARRVIAMEIDALSAMSARLGPEFERAVELILRCPRRVIVCGMGKSGHIGRKIAATMASTGTAAFFVHPGEAFHGDLGMILPEDVVLLISNSGETDELVRLLPFLQQQGNAQALAASEGAAQRALFSCWYSDCDNIVYPTRSATLDGADNHLLHGLGHVHMVYAPQVRAACWQALQTVPGSAASN